MNNNKKIKFELLEETERGYATLKGIITGDRFNIEEEDRLFIYNEGVGLTALIVFKDFNNSSDIDEDGNEVEKYSVYL